MTHRLPSSLEHFLSLYPHPAFALRASALYDALVSRRNPYAPQPTLLTGGADASSVPRYGVEATEGTGSGRGKGLEGVGGGDAPARKKKGSKLTAREQYEGGVEDDSSDDANADASGDADEGATTVPMDQTQGASSGDDLVRARATSDGSASASSAASPSLAPPGPVSALRPPSIRSAPSSASASTDSSVAASASASRRGGSSTTGTGTGSAGSATPSGSGTGTPAAAQSRRSADAGSNPRAHARAERILAETFDAPASASSKGESNSSGGKRPFVASSLLEGGAQKSHDPSRTAEGAVKAMYEQRAQREKDDREREERVAEREEMLEDERREREKREFETADRWTWRRGESDDRASARGDGGAPSAVGTSSSGGVGGGGVGGGSGGSRASGGSGPASSGRGHAQGLGLRDLLTPVWRNGKWKEMMAVRDDAKTRRSAVQPQPAAPFDKATSHGPAPNDRDSVEQDEDEIELIALLSRADAQECLAMLANVVEPLHPSKQSEERRQRDVPLAQLNHTVLLELNFPESSIYRHPPGSTFTHRHSTSDSRQQSSRDAGPQGVPSVYQVMQPRHSADLRSPPLHAPGTPPAVPILPRNPPSERTVPIYSPSNAYQTPCGQSASPEAARGSPSSATAVGGPGLPASTRTSISTAASTSSSTTPGPNPPASNQNPAVPPAHHGVQQETHLLRPFLQLVATLDEDSDLVIVTTILANMPLPVTVTGTPGEREKEEQSDEARLERKREKVRRREERKEVKEAKRVEQEQAESRDAEHEKEKEKAESEAKANAEQVPPLPLPRGLTDGPGAGENGADSNATSTSNSPQQPSSNKSTPPSSNSPFPQGYKPSRPPLAQRGMSYSSLSGASSSGSTVVGTALIAPPVPRPVSPRSSADLSHPHNLSQPLPPTSSEPTYHSRGVSAPLQTPAISDELKELWADMDRSGTFKNEPPVGFVEEKESRAAIRRRGGGALSLASQREYDNEVRERKWQRREKKRERERQREEDDRDAGRGEGLSELLELDEPNEHEKERDREEGVEDEDGVRRLDEESEDDTDLDRLRRQTRTGSTSSAGSAHEREEALRASQAEQQQLQELGPSRSISQQRPRSDDAVSATGSLASSASSASSRASRVSTSVHPPRLSGDSGLVVHELPSAADVSGRVSHTFDDPFLNTIAQTPCGRLIISVDWSRTSLGPIMSWGAEVRSHVMSMLASPFHTAIWLGEDSVLLYNDAYSRILGPSKHPAAMGKMGAEGWQEIWETLGPLAAQVMLGKTMSFSDHCNCIYRNGMLEETYMTWAFMPVRAADASIIGYTVRRALAPRLTRLRTDFFHPTEPFLRNHRARHRRTATGHPSRVVAAHPTRQDDQGCVSQTKPVGFDCC